MNDLYTRLLIVMNDEADAALLLDWTKFEFVKKITF